MPSLNNIDWEDLLDSLENQKCVLFLGSGAYQADGGGDMQEALIQHLDATNPDHPLIRLYNPDGFFLFKKNRYRRKIVAQAKEFYNQSFPETEQQFAKLAQIPFNMIFSLTPDNILGRTFDAEGFDYQSDFYFHHRKAPDEFEKPTQQKPLIYNLLGNIEEPESMVLTHGDFFDYLDSVFQNNSMHEQLKENLEHAEHYIFLGLPYEKWYFQLLLRVLSMHSDKLKEIERLALKEFEDPHLHKLYTSEFKLEFIPSDITSFLDALYAKCKEEEMLKEKPKLDPEEAAIGEVNLEIVKEWVADNQMKKALLHLKVFLIQNKPRSQKLADELSALRNRYKLLEQRNTRGTIYPQDYSVEHNQIVEQLLSLINKAQAL